MRNEEIDKRLDKIENRQTEFRETIDHMVVNQGEGMKRINEIHHLLAGTEYEKGKNGGLVGEIGRLRKKVGANTSWRVRITAAGTAIVGVLGFLLIRFSSILNTLREIIKSE